MIDVSDDRGEVIDYLLQPHHLESWVKENGPFANNTILLVRFGWSKYYRDPEIFLGRDENTTLHFPGISGAAAEWIVKNGNIVGVGVDTASVDGGSDLITHKIMYGANIYGLEHVKMLDKMPGKLNFSVDQENAY